METYRQKYPVTLFYYLHKKHHIRPRRRNVYHSVFCHVVAVLLKKAWNCQIAWQMPFFIYEVDQHQKHIYLHYFMCGDCVKCCRLMLLSSSVDIYEFLSHYCSFFISHNIYCATLFLKKSWQKNESNLLPWWSSRWYPISFIPSDLK